MEVVADLSCRSDGKRTSKCKILRGNLKFGRLLTIKEVDG
jgi:hypothetical protein